MQIIVQNESIGYSLNQVLDVSEDRATRWIRKGYARFPEVEEKQVAAPVVEPVAEPKETKAVAKKSAKKRAK